MRTKYVLVLCAYLFLSNVFTYAKEINAPKAGLLNVVLARINNAVQDVKSCCSTVDSKVDTLAFSDKCCQTLRSTIDYEVVPELVSIESKLDVHVIPGLELQASQLDVMESKIDEIIFDTEPLNSKLDVLDEKIDTVGSRLDEIETKIITIDSLVDKIDIDTSFCATINSKVDVLDEKVDTVSSKVDVANIELVSIESKLDVHVIPGLESQASQLDVMESKIDEIIFDTEPLNSKLDVLDEKIDTVGSRLDEIETKIITIDSLVDQIDIDTSFCATINSKVDVLDEKVDTIDSKVDLLLGDEACCQTVISKLDYQVVPGLEEISSKIDKLTVTATCDEICCQTVRSTIDHAVVPELVSIESKLDKWIGPLTEIIDSKIDKLGCCHAESITAGQPILSSGSYKLTGNSTGQIQINASDVILDLCGFTLTNDAGVAIEIASNLTNIEIKNGKIKSDGSQDGILVGAGCKLIYIEDVKIFSCDNGLNLSGADDNLIVGGKIRDCAFESCNKGVYASYVKKLVFKNCEALNCITYGFDQRFAQFNVCENCKALETANDVPNERAIGFSSYGGRGNLFTGCIAEGTQKIELSEFCHGAIGFLLTGESGYMETETKIINCVANSTSLLETDTWASVCGIKIEPVFLPENFESGGDVGNSSTFFYSLDWSSCGRYLVGGGTGGNVIVYLFDGSELSEVASFAHGATINSVNWSPCGKYVAMGGATASGVEVRVLSFDASRLSETAIFAHGTSIFSVDWSPDGKYLAIAGSVDAIDGVVVRVLLLEGSNLVELTNAIVNDLAYSVDWSPCGKYLALGIKGSAGGGGDIRIFSFNGSDLLPILTFPYENTASVSVKWSPFRGYLAISRRSFKFDSTDTFGDLKVLSFDGSDLSTVASVYANLVSFDWSPCGKYLLGVDIDLPRQALMYSFSGLDSLSVIASRNLSFYVSYVSWSPIGDYFAFAQTTGTYLFEVMDSPSKCLIDGNRVCNTSGGNGFQGIGILGTGENFYIRNVAADNDVNFNKAVCPHFGNIFGPMFAGSPEIWDNLMVNY